MATTDGVTSTGAADALTGSANQVTRNTGGSLGKDDFLKLLVGQMKNMDPLGAGNSDPSQSMAQMTQFSILEQLTNLSESTKASSTLGLIGRTVTYSQKDGVPAEGIVESVQTVDGKRTLTIGGKGGINPDMVLEVR
jgi:flagellar basal-body rod modification protein FlgD